MHRYILHDDQIRESRELCLSPGQVGLMTGWGVFTTIRISQGALFAYERHFARMQKDAKLLRVPFPDSPDCLKRNLLKLAEANGAVEGTLRVNVIRNRGGLFEGPAIDRDFSVLAFTTDLARWGDSVRLGVIPNARHAANQFAGTKVTSWAFNLNMYEEAHERGFDEVVLLTETGEVSECTSANIFAVFGDQVITPPLTSGCLAGVTRAVLLEEITVPGVQVLERTMRLEDLERADGVFITSSTRELLPVVEIEGLTIKTGGGGAYSRLREAFRAYLLTYIETVCAVKDQA